jgi:hypothetical protein
MNISFVSTDGKGEFLNLTKAKLAGEKFDFDIFPVLPLLYGRTILLHFETSHFITSFSFLVFRILPEWYFAARRR